MIPEAPAPSEPVQVLFVVDDDTALVESLADVLSDEGYRIEGFTEPTEALDRLRGGARPAALLLDYLMPAMTGEEFVQHLAEARIDIPILLLSGLSEVCSSSTKVIAVLPKPIDLDQLLTEIGRISKGARARPGPGQAAPSVRSLASEPRR